MLSLNSSQSFEEKKKRKQATKEEKEQKKKVRTDKKEKKCLVLLDFNIVKALGKGKHGSYTDFAFSRDSVTLFQPLLGLKRVKTNL